MITIDPTNMAIPIHLSFPDEHIIGMLTIARQINPMIPGIHSHL